MKPKIYDENRYDLMLKEFGKSSYRVIQPKDPIVSILFPQFQDVPFVAACISTGAGLETPLTYGEFSIPKGTEIIAQRIFRYCNHDGALHLNADDTLYFQDKSGHIIKVSRCDAPDHYKQIAEFGGIGHIAQAYYLPKQDAGPSSKYAENGALIPIKMDCPPDTKVIRIEDIKIKK